jgi:hypothetical protein
MSQEQFFDGQLWLGAPDERITTTSASDLSSALYEHRVGGQPVLMYPTNTSANANATKEQLEVLKCPTCKSNHDVALLSQVFAPLFDQERILYVFICKKCAKGITALQQQTQSRSGGDLSKHFDKAIFAVRCQNFTPDAVKKYETLFSDEATTTNTEEGKKTEATTTTTTTKTTGAFVEDDDWGDDDNEKDKKNNNNKVNAASALVNVAAQKLQQDAEKKRKEEELEQKRKNRPLKKPVVQSINPVFGLTAKPNKGFAEFSLDIYDCDEDASGSDDGENSDSDEDGASGAETSSADIKKQLDELKKKFPNAEVIDGSQPSSTQAGNDLNADDDDEDLEGEDADDGNNKKNNNKKNSKKAASSATNPEIAKQKELQMAQFDLFVKRIKRQGNTQVIRWQPNGFPLLAAPVPIAASNNFNNKKVQQQQQQKDVVILGIPKCDRCGCDRMFEYQLVSPLIYFLSRNAAETGAVATSKKKPANVEAIDEEEILNFATIIVFTCSNPYCDIGNEYVRDFVIVQQEPIADESQQQQQQAAVTAVAKKK